MSDAAVAQSSFPRLGPCGLAKLRLCQRLSPVTDCLPVLWVAISPFLCRIAIADRLRRVEGAPPCMDRFPSFGGQYCVQYSIIPTVGCVCDATGGLPPKDVLLAGKRVHRRSHAPRARRRYQRWRWCRLHYGVVIHLVVAGDHVSAGGQETLPGERERKNPRAVC